MGIGTGRIAIDIAKFGYKVTGIDISKKMLKKVMKEAKKQKVENNIETINASISDFKLETPADFVYLPFRTFGHLMTEPERIKAFLRRKRQVRQNTMNYITLSNHKILLPMYPKTLNLLLTAHFQKATEHKAILM